jgi:hypothetical protein
MPRHCWVLAALAWTACGPRARSPESLLPDTVGGVWHRAALGAGPPLPAGARRSFEAIYQGPGRLTVDVYDLVSFEKGLDLVQHWKPAADAVFFNKDHYFAVVKWTQADRKALNGFVSDLQRILGAHSSRGSPGPAK